MRKIDIPSNIIITKPFNTTFSFICEYINCGILITHNIPIIIALKLLSIVMANVSFINVVFAPNILEKYNIMFCKFSFENMTNDMTITTIKYICASGFIFKIVFESITCSKAINTKKYNPQII